jgi:hypothetical protein
LDVVLATFSAVQLVLSLGAAVIAFSLRKTFEGGIFERAWQVIGYAPIVYGVGQAFQLVKAVLGNNSTIGSLANVIEVAFLVLLVSGFFMFASAWRGIMSRGSGGKPTDATEEGYAKTAKGALVFVLGRGGASGVITYTGEPSIEGFESKLHKVLGDGAAVAIRHMVERRTDQSKKEEEKTE